MLEQEIVKLLSKISQQLEEVSANQAEIKKEILNLHIELATFEEMTLQSLQDRLSQMSPAEMMN